MSSSLNISIDTSEILDIAEKLIYDVEKKIAQVNYGIKNFRLDDSSYADESVLYIREVVNTKFKELNRDILSLDDDYCSDGNEIEYQNCHCEQRNNNTMRLPRVFTLNNNNKQIITNEEQKSGSESKPQLKVKKKKGILNKTDSIKSQSSQLSVTSSLKLDLLSNDNNIIKKNNSNIPELKNDSCERKQKKESPVDIAVQTSIQETPHEKPASLDKSQDLLTGKNISSDSISNDKIKPETINPGDDKRQHLCKTNFQQRHINENTKKSNGSFIEFMCRIVELETNNVIEMNTDDLIEENRHQLSYNKTIEDELINDDFDFNKINLYSPKFEHVDKILNKFDEKMKTFSENANKLVNIFSRIIVCNNNSNVNLKITKSDTREKNFDGVKLSFKAQTRNLSPETTITSKSLKPAERFSTLLNNYSVNIDTKNISNDIEEPPTPIIKPDINNDSKVFITRNKLSLSASTIENCDKVAAHEKSEIELHLSEILQTIQKQINEKRHSDECHDFSYNDNVKEFDCQQETEVNYKVLENSFNITNQKICDNKKNQFETTKSSFSNEKTLSKSVKLRQSSKNTPLQINQNVEPDYVEMNLVVDSSKDDVRDRTSFDVSAIYSESFETASFSENENTLDELKNSNDDKIENFELNKENHGEFEPCLSIDREKNNTNVYNVIEELKDKSQTGEKIIPISDNEKNSINIANSLNLSIQSSTKQNEDKKQTLSLSLESFQLLEKIPSVEILQEKMEKSSSDQYSEGELPLPISLGEVRLNGTPDSQENENSNYYQNLNDQIHNILNSTLQSLGEILNSNGDSTSSKKKNSYYLNIDS
ncbi:MATH and LRR domain-containing protein PFE0570w-like isoform X1 [Cotesia glomerata]|uniref:MATH and LRR domain-containing protein PFE0570w-like isoform X1 n=1 Tax=Cotesia glomerata TaxID=32391 RepID=UPI001D018DFE|nr:MATH and LRR domain-containing protein PFE0570w-like isoform X1 [Cotesia glomerata]